MHCELEQLAIFVSNLNDLHLGCAKAKFEISRNQSRGDYSLCDSGRGLDDFHPYDLLVAVFG